MAAETPARSLGVEWGAGKTRHRIGAQNWKLPLRWNAKHSEFYAEHGRRRRVFCASLAFLMSYYSSGGQWGDLREPLDTVTTRDRLALVTVQIRGVPYVIVDIGMRMLEPRELYTAQGFGRDYIIDRTADERQLPKHAQVRMVGNSVSPPPLRVIAEANLELVRGRES